jgi:hypothetical protein
MPFIHQVVSADRCACDPLGKDIQTKKGEADSINNAALALPVLAEDVILPRNKVQAGGGEGPKSIQR